MAGRVPWDGDRLRQLRERAGLTRRELARRSGLSEDALYKMETGARVPGFDSMEALRDALGKDTLDVFREPPDPGHQYRGPGARRKAPPAEPPPPKRPRGRPPKKKT